MKRDPRLHPLSHEHHQALVLARRATRAASADGDRQTEVWNEVVRTFHQDLAPHFAIEEEVILPALDNESHAHLAQRTRDEHVELRRLVCDNPQETKDRLASFGAFLHDHVRFEERELFPALEADGDDEVLEAVAAACKRSHE